MTTFSKTYKIKRSGVDEADDGSSKLNLTLEEIVAPVNGVQMVGMQSIYSFDIPKGESVDDFKVSSGNVVTLTFAAGKPAA